MRFPKRADGAGFAPSFNGRTADSGSAYRGSNPWGAANLHTFAGPRSRRTKPVCRISSQSYAKVAPQVRQTW